MSVNPAGAAKRLLALGHVVPRTCLIVADKVIMQGRTHPRHALTAYGAWRGTPKANRHTSWPAPNDVPVYFSGAGGFGDVAVSDNGKVAGIDTHNGVYAEGQVGLQTLAQREHQLGGKFLGWTDDFMGAALHYTPVPPPAETEAHRTRRVAAYLNGRQLRLHPTDRLPLVTSGAKNGKRGYNFWRELRLAAKADDLIPASSRIVGIGTAAARKLEDHYSTIAPAI